MLKAAWQLQSRLGCHLQLQSLISETTISFPLNSFCLQIPAEVSKIGKSLRCDLNFVFIKLPEAAKSFVKIRLVLEMKNVTSFIKTRFYCRRGCIKRRKYAETFHNNNAYKLAIVTFYTNFLCIHCGTLFKCYFHYCTPTLPPPPNFQYENESPQHCLSHVANYNAFSLWSPVFRLF